MLTSQIMGIVNVTPDSFFDGGILDNAEKAIAHGLKLVEEGAVVLDIGGESTRPGADDVSVAEELARVMPVIEGLVGKAEASISIDTRKPEVAKVAVAAGADIWNDVSALTYADDSFETALALDVPVILMHAQGDPKTMQDAPSYTDVTQDVYNFLMSRAHKLIDEGFNADKIILDPGIGFGKTTEHNIELLAKLDLLTETPFPILLGASRKRFISTVDRNTDPAGRLGGSIAAALIGAQQGVAIFRVHDVAATRQALAVFEAAEVLFKDNLVDDFFAEMGISFEGDT